MHAPQLDFGGYSPLNQPNGKTSQNVEIGPSMRPVGVAETPKKKEKKETGKLHGYSPRSLTPLDRVSPKAVNS